MPTATAEVKSKLLSRQISIKADDGGTLPSKIELLQTGMWDAPYHGCFMITSQDLQEYVANFNADIRANSSSQGLPIDYEHDVDGGAAGWITGLSIGPPSDMSLSASGVQSLWADVSWTPPGAQALQDRVYQFISPEFCPDEYIDPEGIAEPCDNVLIGAGLTNRPLFKKLQPLMASDDAHKQASSDEDKIYIKLKENKSVELNQIRTKSASDLSDDEKKFLADHKAELSADEKAKFGLSADENNDAAEKARLEAEAKAKADKEAADKKAADDAEAAKQASEKAGMVTISASELAAIKAKADRGDVAASEIEKMQASEHINSLCFNEKDGVKFKPAQREEVLSFFMSCNDSQREQFNKIVKEITPISASANFKKDGSEEESGDSSARVQMTMKANELMKANTNLKFSDALKQVTQENPELAKSYREELQTA